MILLDNLKARLRILPMFTNMLGTSTTMLVVVEFIVNCIRTLIWRYESYEIWDMNFFGEVLNVKSQINYLSVIFAFLVEGYQMGSSNFINNSITDFKEILNFLVAVESGLEFSRLFFILLFLVLRINLLLLIILLWNFFFFYLFFDFFFL